MFLRSAFGSRTPTILPSTGH